MHFLNSLNSGISIMQSKPYPNTTDICIIGAGMVGLSIAHQIMQRNSTLSITLIDKEADVGEHGSGRNSGVLHAGLYYPPDSLKAKVCVAGAKRLRAWCEEEGLPILACGKVITPQKPELDSQLDLLLKRGLANGAEVELINETQFFELVPDGRTSTGRAIWSPGTCVVKPKLVIQRLRQRLTEQGAKFFLSQPLWRAVPDDKKIVFRDGNFLTYGHLFNCAGLHADQVAQAFGIGAAYTMLPFRGNYWQLKADAPFLFKTNLYPVPDLEVPFLGVHVTPSVDGITYLGPTATPALGRENYRGLKGADPLLALGFARHMATQWLLDKKMRRYVREQACQGLPRQFLNAARAIIPRLEAKYIERSSKVGIRPQLYDRVKCELVQDFVMMPGPHSTHIINAVSPAFTASFELADMILNQSAISL